MHKLLVICRTFSNNEYTFLCTRMIFTEKAMATHSSTLAWKIPWTEEPSRLQFMGSLGVGHDWVTSHSVFTFHFHALEKEMATYSSVLAWRIPGTGLPGGLPSMGSHRVRHDWRFSSSSSRICTKFYHVQRKPHTYQGTSNDDTVNIITNS